MARRVPLDDYGAPSLILATAAPWSSVGHLKLLAALMAGVSVPPIGLGARPQPSGAGGKSSRDREHAQRIDELPHELADRHSPVRQRCSRGGIAEASGAAMQGLSTTASSDETGV
jgi:hypothetical protein